MANYSSQDVKKSSKILEDNGMKPNIMIDASHANSNKDFKMQSKVVD